jgi:Na+/proline symporter
VDSRAGTAPFTQDIVRHYASRENQRKQVGLAELGHRIISHVFRLSLIPDFQNQCVDVYWFAVSGVVAALFWKRSTKYGAYASILSVVVLWLYFFLKGSETIGDAGLMPVAVILAVSAAAMVIGSLLTKPPDEATLQKFFATDGYIGSGRSIREAEKAKLSVIK